MAQGAGLAAETGAGAVKMLLQVLPRALLEPKEVLRGPKLLSGRTQGPLWSNTCPLSSDHIQTQI